MRNSILWHLSLKDLHRCCIATRKLANWAKPHIDASPVVLLLGGMTSDWWFVDRPIVVDPRGDQLTWHQIGPHLRPRSRAGVVGLPGRRVMVAGGLSLKDNVVDHTTEILDPVTMTWCFAKSMCTPRVSVGCCFLPGAPGRSAKAVYTGGVTIGTDNVGGVTSVEMYDPERDEWTVAAELNGPRHSHVCSLIGHSAVLVAGGKIGDSYLNTAEIYDPTTNCWTALLQKMPMAVSQSASLQLPDGRCAIFGGWNGEATVKTACVCTLPKSKRSKDKDNDKSAKPASASASDVYASAGASSVYVRPADIAARGGAAGAEGAAAAAAPPLEGGVDFYSEKLMKMKQEVVYKVRKATWEELPNMASALADFAVISDPSFGVLAIHAHDETQYATVSDFTLPVKRRRRRRRSSASGEASAATVAMVPAETIGVKGGAGARSLRLPVRLQACSGGAGMGAPA